jgi:DNA polymerase-1
MKTVLLIDGDIIAYKHASGSEVAVDWGDDWWTLHTDTKKAKIIMNKEVERLAAALHADRIEIALSGKKNFRHRVDANYKSGRKKTRKPIGLPCLREELMLNWRAQIHDDLEADDLLGVWATDPMYHAGSRKIIVSIDKDMKTIPCNLWNWNYPELGVQNISKEAADYNHLIQTLMGDSTDGYKGCPTVGPTKAARILNPNPTWESVVRCFEAHDLSEEEALKQARLARILRVENYNLRKREIKFWTPNKE